MPTLHLITPNAPMLEAATIAPSALARALGVEAADGWVVFDHALPRLAQALARDPASARWGTRLFVIDRPATLVGWGGFKGAPEGGMVEVGYAIAPGWRAQGLAGQALSRMLDEAFADEFVDVVRAHTAARPGPSPAVLERAGFTNVATIDDPGVSIAWRFELTRGAWRDKASPPAAAAVARP